MYLKSLVKNINDDPEKYFTKEVLDKIDEIAKRKFQYGFRRRRTIKDTPLSQRQIDDFSCIKIMDATSMNIIYKYNNVKFSSTENENNEIPLKFTYDVMTNPNNEDVKSNDFRNYINDILVECVEEQLKNVKITNR